MAVSSLSRVELANCGVLQTRLSRSTKLRLPGVSRQKSRPNTLSLRHAAYRLLLLPLVLLRSHATAGISIVCAPHLHIFCPSLKVGRELATRGASTNSHGEEWGEWEGGVFITCIFRPLLFPALRKCQVQRGQSPAVGADKWQHDAQVVRFLAYRLAQVFRHGHC